MGTKITDLPAILAGDVDEADVDVLDDVSAPETKKITVAERRKVMLGRSIAFGGVIAAGSIATQTDDWAPPGYAAASVYLFSVASADHSLTGLAGGVKGAVKILVNTGTTFAAVLRGEHTSSVAANRIADGPDGDPAVWVHPRAVAVLIYDDTADGGVGRWRAVSIAKLSSATFAGLMSAAQFTKLAGIEALADVTDAANVNAAGAIMHTDIPGSVLGRVIRTGSETYNVVLDNYGASTAPTINDDVTAGYSVGSFWWDLTADRFYTCVDATDGAAKWIAVPNLADTGTQIFAGEVVVGQLEVVGAALFNDDIAGVGAIFSGNVEVGEQTNPQDATRKDYVDAQRTTIATESSDTHTFADADSGKTFRCTHASGCVVTVPSGLTPGTSARFIAEDADSPVSVVGSGLTLRHGATFDPETAERYSSLVITILDTDEALVEGDLAPV